MEENYKVLIVDDEFYIRKGLLSFDWESFGFSSIGSASNGKAAIEILEKERADLVITDVKMPVLDGLALCRYINETLPNCKTIILSGYKEFDYAKEAIANNVYAYLLKPIELNELEQELTALKAELDRQHASQQILSRYQRENTPAEPQPLEKSSTTGLAVQQVINHIKTHYQEKLTLSEMSELVYLTPSYFSILFKRETGQNFIDYLTVYRIEQAKKLLAQLDLKIYEIGQMVGYENSKYFTDTFKKYAGISPKEYRNSILTRK